MRDSLRLFQMIEYCAGDAIAFAAYFSAMVFRLARPISSPCRNAGRIVAAGLWLAAVIFFLLCLKFVEVIFQAVETLVPELAILLHPIGNVAQWLRFEPAGPPLRLATLRDQAGALQYLEMLGNGGRAYLERLGELRDRCFARRETRKDRAASRIGECGEDSAEVIGWHL